MVHLAARLRSPALRPFIKSLHYHEAAFPFGLERILPNGQAHLMINLAENEFRTYSGTACERIDPTQGAVLSGPRGQATILDTGEFQWMLAVEFRHGGAAPFFPLPLHEVCDQAVALDALWGLDGRLLRDQLLEASTPQCRLRVLEAALLAHFAGTADPAIAHAVTLLSRGVPVAATASRLGFLPKTFVRRFRERVGLTPKRFARVRRMQRIAARVRGSVEPDWSAIAAEHGYSDQAHLIHDFRDLTGITPAAYKPHSPQRGNHVPITIQPR